METELRTGALAPSASTASAAHGIAGFGGGSTGVRSRSAGAVAAGSGRGGMAAAPAGAEAGDGGKHHAGLLSETAEDSRSRSRGAKVGGWGVVGGGPGSRSM